MVKGEKIYELEGTECGWECGGGEKVIDDKVGEGSGGERGEDEGGEGIGMEGKA